MPFTTLFPCHNFEIENLNGGRYVATGVFSILLSEIYV